MNNSAKADLRRSRFTAVIFASLTVLLLLMFVYAFIQKTQADMLMERVKMLEGQLNICQEELNALRNLNQSLE